MSFSLSQATLSPRTAALTGTLQLSNGANLKDGSVKLTCPKGSVATEVPFLDVVALAVTTLKSQNPVSIRSVGATGDHWNWFNAATTSTYAVSRDFIAAVKNAAKLAGLKVAQNEDLEVGAPVRTVKGVNLFVILG